MSFRWTLHGSSVEVMERRVEITEVDVQDLKALAQWSREVCQSRSVETLAAALEVEATVDAVAAKLSKGLPAESRRVVVEVCKRELSSPAEPRRS